LRFTFAVDEGNAPTRQYYHDIGLTAD
jgi:hypothetical protein